MLRAASDENKENPSRAGGCGCNRVYLYQNVEILRPKILPDRLKLEPYGGLRDITSQKNNICRCITRKRSKSSNEENIQRDRIVGSDPNNYVQRGVIKRPTERHKITSYNHIFKREIREILEDKQPTPKTTSLNRFSKNQVKPTILISSSHHTYNVYNDKHYTKEFYNSTELSTPYSQHEMFSSTQLPIPEINQVRRHSCSSVIESKEDHFAHFQQYGRKSDYKTACCAPKTNLIANDIAKPSSIQVYQDGQSNIQNNNGQYQKYGYYLQGLRAKNDDYRKTVVTPISTNATIRGRIPSAVAGYKLQQQFNSPILPNTFTKQSTLISTRPEKLREPKIKKRIYKNAYLPNRIYVGDIYNREYLNDIIRNIRKQEQEITLNENFLLRYNSNSECRAGILNWILKEQAYLNFSESEYYLAVNLLDHVLANVPVPINMYQLTIISTLWIAMKIIGSNIFKASTLISLCENAYLTEQLLKMEQKVLKIMKFKIHTTEPSVCVNYYLKCFNLHEDILAKLSVFYILDSFSLTPQFSSTRVSTLAAACVRYTLTRYHERKEKHIDYTFRRLLPKEEIERIKNIEAHIYLQLINMSDENYVFKEPYYKYGKQKGVMQIETTLNL